MKYRFTVQETRIKNVDGGRCIQHIAHLYTHPSNAHSACASLRSINVTTDVGNCHQLRMHGLCPKPPEWVLVAQLAPSRHRTRFVSGISLFLFLFLECIKVNDEHVVVEFARRTNVQTFAVLEIS